MSYFNRRAITGYAHACTFGILRLKTRAVRWLEMLPFKTFANTTYLPCFSFNLLGQIGDQKYYVAIPFISLFDKYIPFPIACN